MTVQVTRPSPSTPEPTKRSAVGLALPALTALVVGSMIGTFVGRALWGGADYSAGWITSILGTIIILAIYRAVKKKQAA